MGYIYKIINDVNDKIYIGQTINSINYRFKCHINEANQFTHKNKFHIALLEIGPEHFNIEIIEECANDQLNNRECYWIKFYDSVNNGYNTTWGGSTGIHYDREQLLKLWNTGFNIIRISEKIGIDRGLLAQILRNEGIGDEEIKNRHYEACRIQSKNRKIYQINPHTGEIINTYDSINSAAQTLNISHSTIIKCCQLKPQAKTGGGYAWRYIENYNEETDKQQLINYCKRIPNNSKIILRYDKDNHLIEQYLTASDAEEKTGISKSSITKYCRGERIDPRGYIWKYKIEEGE